MCHLWQVALINFIDSFKNDKKIENKGEALKLHCKKKLKKQIGCN